jgi:HAD superfamily hydrolase (TIGR01484 family)
VPESATLATVLPRLVATDLDGTLLRDDGTIDARTDAALRAMRARGVEVVVCTARPVRWMRDLAGDGAICSIAVCANGAVLWDLRGEALVRAFPVSSDIAREVVRRLRAIVGAGAWAVESVDSFAHEPGYRTRWPIPDDTVVDDIDALLDPPPVKLLLRPDHEAGAARFAARAREAVADLVEVTYSDSSASLLEMSAAGVSKGSGLAALCAERGIDAAQVIAFGDMPNDLSMLAWAGRSYAMGNAHPEVAAAADEVTLTNERNGVAAVLERLLAEDGQT